MRTLRTVLALLVVGAFLLCVSTSADAQKKKGKGKKGKATVGKLVKVDIKDDGTGSITVKSRGKKKKGADAQPGKEATFKVTAETKVLKASGKKGEKPAQAKASDLKVGQNVAVFATADAPDTASAVIMLAGGKGKKKKKDAN